MLGESLSLSPETILTSSASAQMLSEYWDGAIGLSISTIWGNIGKLAHPELCFVPLEMIPHQSPLELLGRERPRAWLCHERCKSQGRKGKEERVYLFLVYAGVAGFLSWWRNPTLHSHGQGTTKFLWLTQKILQNKYHFIYSQGTGLLQDLCLDAGFGIVNLHYFQMAPKVLTVKETWDPGV